MNFDKTTILIGNGHLNKGLFFDLNKKNLPIIAADGGANHLQELNMVPEAIIGDFDSITDEDYWSNKTKLIKIEDQNSTDLEKCLDEIQSPLFLAFGFCGDRFDHSLEMMHTLSKYKDKKIIFFCDRDIVFRLPQRWQVKLPVETRISFYPLQKTAVKSSQGLKYELNNLNLRQGEQIGTSNLTIREDVVIETEEGSLAGILNAKYYLNIINSLI